ncbi:GNAT family N-acetyltransferase [Bacillus thuringiensis]|uniref:GNAT family N-acetyltransferase n=1 Tax=Bacillus thuringiensis TaxID=1428 RepID=A0A9X7BHI7_BACTU|nr:MULTISPECIES: GNAT family N-acetyltransferase [Bacillus cereus group]MDF9528359.1 GNAT family N-acetyltransferase [Bacillus cereus]MDG1576481.1 GNAT family N-acetyltransferase [Bacillus cereus]MED4446331.1 GNAT family N-acetyltransferase [Bacillus cereus]PEB43935.1 GNAT family N-acetyltransferase [Bacillus thuringiensis]PED28247.1 GNAT family N-acetyltransferase [Bacillus thuringiensis]
MEIEICTDAQYWDACMDEYNGSVFHSYEWGKLMELLPGVQFFPVLIETRDTVVLTPMYVQNGRLLGSLIGYGGPIIIGQDKIDFSVYESIINKKFENNIQKLLLPITINPFQSYCKEKWDYKETYMLDLPNRFEDLWTSCSGKARTSVRYARKQNVEVRPITVAELDEFYQLYQEHNTSIGASYSFSREFFYHLVLNLQEKILFLGAFLEEELISSSIFIMDKKVLYYWININNTEGKNSQSSYLLLNDAFELAIHNKLKYADLGYSHNKGIARPKIYWGAALKKCFCLKERI